ncbi:MAG: DHHA1 domain-containing protein [Candidatus Azambacteria bacterium]|nr:DHHA1 domain-containing protein [Candidatus Azambacteria bacterium]
MKNSSFKEIEKIILKAKNILAITHQGPDPDAVGSLAAFGFYLKKIKKPHYLLCTSVIPESLKFIPGAKSIKSKHPKHKFDLMTGLDYGTKILLGMDNYFKKYPEIPLLVFDHHLSTNQGANFGIVNPKYSSACEVLYDYFNAISFKIDRQIAYALTVGILADTGFFRYTNNPKPLETVLSLVKQFGIKPVEIDNKLNGQVKTEALKVYGAILSRLKHNHKSDFIYSWLKRKDLSKHHLATSDLTDIVSQLKDLKDGRFSLFLIEESQGKIRGRLRSRPDKKFNVAELAEKIGGGGHRYAAGFRHKGSIDSALKLVAKYSR